VKQVFAYTIEQKCWKLLDSDVVPDGDLFPEIDQATLPDSVCQIIDLFERAEITVIIRDITSDIGIPTFVAASKEIGLEGNDVVCYGTGTHFSAQVAVIRALTECAQKRVIAFRELNEHRAEDRFVGTNTHISPESILFVPSSEKRKFPPMSMQYNWDIVDDITMMLARLSGIGLHQVIAVDLTLTELKVPVVRVIIPGIEDWSAFDFSPRYCMLGYRGQKYLNGN
jgi:thioglycine synthase